MCTHHSHNHYCYKIKHPSTIIDNKIKLLCGMAYCSFTAIPVILANHHFITTIQERVLYSQCWQQLLAAKTDFCFSGSTFRTSEASTAPTFEQETGGLVFRLYLYLCVLGSWPVFYLACAKPWSWWQTVMCANSGRCASSCCWLVNRRAEWHGLKSIYYMLLVILVSVF